MVLISFNGINTLYISNTIAKYLDCPLYSFSSSSIKEYQKYEHKIDTLVNIGKDVVINNNYFSILAYSSDILTYKHLQDKISSLSILPKISPALPFFIVSKDVDKSLKIFSPFKEVTDPEHAKRVNNEYKRIYLIYSYIYKINPILIEVDPHNPECISKTITKIKYIVGRYKKNYSF